MKTQSFLNFMMATVIVILLFYIRSSADQPIAQPEAPFFLTGSPTCRYTEISGFTDAKEVSTAAAAAQSKAFEDFAKGQGQSIFGGVISKAALDSLFCGGAYNGLAYTLAMDPSGKHGPANAVFIIVGGVKVEKDEKISAQSPDFYTNNLWCPPSCLSFSN